MTRYNNYSFQLSHQKNPECGDKQSFSVYYTKAEGPNDTLHYFWDFWRKPTVFVALTPKSDDVHFDCDNFEKNGNNSFYFGSDPLYTFALVLNKVDFISDRLR